MEQRNDETTGRFVVDEKHRTAPYCQSQFNKASNQTTPLP
jgi:hypothetical protein